MIAARRASALVVLTTLIVAGSADAQTPAVSTAAQAATSSADVLQRRISLDLREVTLEAALDTIAARGHVRVMYSPSHVPLASVVSLVADSVTIRGALEKLLRGTGTRISVAPAGWVVLDPLSDPAPNSAVTRDGSRQGMGSILGFLFDSATKAPLPFVVITLEETGKSGNSGNRADYAIAPLKHGTYHVTAKRVGYTSQTRAILVDNDTLPARLDFYLARTPAALDEVVTTATGDERRYQIGNDITVLNADSILAVAPVQSVTDLLATRVPGLTVQPTQGIPGAPARLRLRGLNSIDGNDDPMIIVDGARFYYNQSGGFNNTTAGAVNAGQQGGGFSIGSTVGLPGGAVYTAPASLDQIDPNTIEKIEVMKGPSASALYGSDAGNGVIIITTKRGRPGPTRWTMTTDEGVESQPGSWPVHYYRFGHGIGTNSDGSTLCSLYDGPARCVTDSIVPFQALNSSKYSPLGTGDDTHASLGATGGAGPITFAVTGSVYNKNGYLHLPAIEDQRFLAFHGFDAPGWMRNPNAEYGYSGSSRIDVQLGKHGALLSVTSLLSSTTQLQTSLQANALDQLQNLYVDSTQLAASPLLHQYYERAVFHVLTVVNNATLSGFSPIRWLPLTLTLGLNLNQNNGYQEEPRGYDIPYPDTVGSYTSAQMENIAETITLSTSLHFGMVSALSGFNIQNQTSAGLQNGALELPLGVVTPSVFDGGVQSSTAQTTFGWYVEPTFTLGSRLFASPGFRIDGGSTSGANSASTIFPKMDVSYYAIKPTDHPLFGVMSALRPRVAFGVAGVQPSPGAKLRLLQPNTAIVVDTGALNGTSINTASLYSLGNSHLSPERQLELEYGVDLEFFRGRLTLTTTGFYKMRYDAIVGIPTAPSVGGVFSNTIDKNIGTIRNTGFEITAGLDAIETRAVHWSFNSNFSTVANKVVSLSAGQGAVVLSNSSPGVNFINLAKVGFPLDGYFARPILSYADANHDGIIEPGEVRLGDSVVYLGHPLPAWTLNFSTHIVLFNSFFFDTGISYDYGMTQFNDTESLDLLTNQPHVTLAQEAAAASSALTAYGLTQTVNTLRFGSLSFGYTVPPRYVRWFRASSMSIAVQTSNLGLITNYRGKDPAVNAYSTGASTADFATLPQPRRYYVHLNLGL